MPKIPLLFKTIITGVILTILGFFIFSAFIGDSTPEEKLNSLKLLTLLLFLSSVLLLYIAYKLRYQMFYLEGSLDALEQPITTTNINMKWKFINKVTESLLAQHNLDKKSVIGKHCSSWKADICETENCGITCLRNNKPRTHYNQEIPNSPSIYMQVDTNYIYNDMGKAIGHVEIVTNIDTTSQLAKTANILSPTSKSLLEVSSNMTENAATMTENTSNIASATEELSSNLSHVASSSKEMSSSVVTVASAIEEMNTTVNEIAKNCSTASKITNNADTQIKSTQTTMEDLNKSAKEIGTILNSIIAIAGKTNLLAINATIEAASAGESGKGFAVVANEVKELAKQTAEATVEIGKQIDLMQGNTEESVTAISDITNVISDINNITQTIASAVEEQSITVAEISKSVSNTSASATQITDNVNQASAGANEISSNIQELSKNAEMTAQDASKTTQSAEEMTKLSDKLNTLTAGIV